MSYYLIIRCILYIFHELKLIDQDVWVVILVIKTTIIQSRCGCLIYIYIYIYIYEVKMVLYTAEEWGMPCFHWLFTKRQMSIRTAEVRPYCFFFLFFFCFGRGTSVARRDHGDGLSLLESCRGYCRSRYDAEITRNRQWRQCITEALPDASKMYDWNIYIYIYYYTHTHVKYIYVVINFKKPKVAEKYFPWIKYIYNISLFIIIIIIIALS